MPATLYSTTNAFPILTGYSTRSFDSGLLLWQGTYITRDTSAPPFAEGDPIPEGNYGAIDGLFVHPAPVLKKSPGPLAEWTVTAYGRTNVTGQKTFTKYLSNFSTRIIRCDGYDLSTSCNVINKNFNTINDKVVWKFISPKTASLNIQIDDALNIYRLNGLAASPVALNEVFNIAGYRNVDGKTVQNLINSKKLTRAENVNFGAWDEWTVVWEAAPEINVLDFGRFYKILPPIPPNFFSTLNVEINDSLTSSFKSISAGYKDGNSTQVVVKNVKNILTSSGAWNNQTPRLDIPFNTNTSTYLGGNFKWFGDASFVYTPQFASRPPGPPSSLGSTYTDPAGFSWRANTEDPEMLELFWSFERNRSESFEFTLENELGQTASGNFSIGFTDSQNP